MPVVSDQKLGRREQRKQADRGRLKAAALRLIAEQGITHFRITDATAAADLGAGTFYSHFDSKDALVHEVVSDALARIAAVIGLRGLEFDDPAEGAAFSYKRFVGFAIDDPEFAAIVIALDDADAIFEQSLTTYARETLQRGVNQGRFNLPDLEMALTIASASALAAIRALLNGHTQPGAEIVGAEMLLRSLGISIPEAAAIAHEDIPDLEL